MRLITDDHRGSQRVKCKRNANDLRKERSGTSILLFSARTKCQPENGVCR